MIMVSWQVARIRDAMAIQCFPVSGLIIQSANPDLQPERLEVSSLKQLWNGQAVMLMLILLACCNYAM